MYISRFSMKIHCEKSFLDILFYFIFNYFGLIPNYKISSSWQLIFVIINCKRKLVKHNEIWIITIIKIKIITIRNWGN